MRQNPNWLLQNNHLQEEFLDSNVQYDSDDSVDEP